LKKGFEFISAISIIVLIWMVGEGCQPDKPLGPNKNAVVNVFMPASNEIRASLLGVAQNELIYRVDGPANTPLAENIVGPFSTSSNYGSVDFSVDIPAGDNLVLSVQLNDASSHQPLAVGAVGLNLLSAPVSDVVIEMGSVTRNCYFVNEIPGSYGATGSAYAFASDSLFNQLSTSGYDIAFSPVSTIGYQIVDAQASSTGALSSIAFLGKGNLIDHDRTPPNSSYFFTNSGSAKQYAVSTGFAASFATTNVEPGDIYFINLKSIPGAHAWVQATDPGKPSTVLGGYGPSFRFRVNSTLPYFGYEQTTVDAASTCSGSW